MTKPKLYRAEVPVQATLQYQVRANSPEEAAAKVKSMQGRLPEDHPDIELYEPELDVDYRQAKVNEVEVYEQ